MNKFLILSAAAAAIAAAGPALADSMATATTDLNVRAGPGTGNPVIGVIGAGEPVSVGACIESGGWCSVAFDGGEGWVSRAYLTGMSGRVVVSDEATSAVRVDRPASPGAGAGAVAGGATGAVAGAIVGGPAGAAIGGAAGLVAGGATGQALDPPAEVRTYVTSHQLRPVRIDGDVVVGSTLPETVVLEPVPDYRYEYVYVNDRPMLVEPGTRRVVYVY
jgi:SH3-like domain-containing protein